MANITTLKKGIIRQLNDDEVVAVHHTIDFTVAGASIADTMDLIDLPVAAGKYLIVDSFLCEVETADGETATADFGIKPTTGATFTADPNGLDDAVDLNAVAVYAGVIGTDAQMGVRILLTTGATVYLTADHALENGKAHLSIVYRVVSA
jgi:hypothetical protein